MTLIKQIICCFSLLIYTMSCFSLDISPYVGVDGQLNRMKFKKGYGDNLFPKNYSQSNLYAGIKLDGSFSLEAGYASEAVRTKYSKLYETDCCLGADIPKMLSPAIFKSYIKIRGYHLGFVNTFCEPTWESVRILWGAGVGLLRAEAERKTIELSIPPVRLLSSRHFKKDKAVLRLMLASEYSLNNNIGIRASVIFLQTSKMVIKAYPINGRYTPVIKPKDSFIYSLGIFYEF